MGRLLALIGALRMLIAAGQMYARSRGAPIAIAKRELLTPPPGPDVR